MLLNVINILFVAVAVALAVSISVFKLFVCRINDNMRLSDYVAGIAVFMLLYVAFAFLCVIFNPNVLTKAVMTGFGLSPFIIGKIATYQTEKFFTCVQIFSIILSVVYILYI